MKKSINPGGLLWRRLRVATVDALHNEAIAKLGGKAWDRAWNEVFDEVRTEVNLAVSPVWEPAWVESLDAELNGV